MDKLLTKKNLAERWGITTKTLDAWVKDGVISPVKGLPSPRFNLEHILKLEGTEISKLSPLERRRLLKEIEDLKLENKLLAGENKELKNYVKLILGQGVKFINVGKEA